MPSLEDLPVGIILSIAATLQSKATLARTNRYLFNVLNPVLYELNLFHSSPTKSCILWGARNGSIGTVERGHQYGGDLNLDVNEAKWPESGAIKAWHKDRWHYLTEYGTALQLALRYDHLDILAYLLEHEANVHAPSLACCRCSGLGRLSYPLHEIICDNPSELSFYRSPERDKMAALMLIRHGAYLQAPGQPILPFLVERGRLDLIIPLLEQPGVDAGAAALTGRTPLHVAADYGMTDIAKLLLDRPEVDIDALDATRHTAAEIAAKQGHTNTLTLLLSRAQTNSIIKPDICVRALHAAAASGQLNSIKLLLKHHSVCPSELNIYGDAALHLAVKGGHDDTVKFLIGRPDVDTGAVGCSGMTAIHYAARDAPEDSATTLIQTLVDAGVDVNATDTLSDRTNTPLRYAIERRRTNVALTLLSCGADPTLEHGPDLHTGMTLLHHCMAPDRSHLSKDELRLVKELIEKGVDTTSTSTIDAERLPARTNGPPLFFAAAYVKSDQCVRWLLEAGASTDFSVLNVLAHAASNPQSLLMALFYYWFSNNYTQGSIPTQIYLRNVRCVMVSVSLLLKYGARLDSVASEQSALQYACDVAVGGCFELLCILLRESTRRNVSVEHVEALKAEYGPRESGRTASGDLRMIQRRGRVFRQLSDFSNRAFRQKTVSLRKVKA